MLCSLGAIAKNDHAMHVVAPRVRGPFKAVQSGKSARLIVLVSHISHVPPSHLGHGGLVNQVRVVGPQPFDECLIAITAFYHVMPFSTLWVRQKQRVRSTNEIR